MLGMKYSSCCVSTAAVFGAQRACRFIFRRQELQVCGLFVEYLFASGSMVVLCRDT